MQTVCLRIAASLLICYYINRDARFTSPKRSRSDLRVGPVNRMSVRRRGRARRLTVTADRVCYYRRWI